MRLLFVHYHAISMLNASLGTFMLKNPYIDLGVINGLVVDRTKSPMILKDLDNSAATYKLDTSLLAALKSLTSQKAPAAALTSTADAAAKFTDNVLAAFGKTVDDYGTGDQGGREKWRLTDQLPQGLASLLNDVAALPTNIFLLAERLTRRKGASDGHLPLVYVLDKLASPYAVPPDGIAMPFRPNYAIDKYHPVRKLMSDNYKAAIVSAAVSKDIGDWDTLYVTEDIFTTGALCVAHTNTEVTASVDNLIKSLFEDGTLEVGSSLTNLIVSLRDITQLYCALNHGEKLVDIISDSYKSPGSVRDMNQVLIYLESRYALVGVDAFLSTAISVWFLQYIYLTLQAGDWLQEIRDNYPTFAKEVLDRPEIAEFMALPVMAEFADVLQGPLFLNSVAMERSPSRGAMYGYSLPTELSVSGKRKAKKPSPDAGLPGDGKSLIEKASLGTMLESFSSVISVMAKLMQQHSWVASYKKGAALMGGTKFNFTGVPYNVIGTSLSRFNLGSSIGVSQTSFLGVAINGVMPAIVNATGVLAPTTVLTTETVTSQYANPLPFSYNKIKLRDLRRKWLALFNGSGYKVMSAGDLANDSVPLVYIPRHFPSSYQAAGNLALFSLGFVEEYPGNEALNYTFVVDPSKTKAVKRVVTVPSGVTLSYDKVPYARTVPELGDKFKNGVPVDESNLPMILSIDVDSLDYDGPSTPVLALRRFFTMSDNNKPVLKGASLITSDYFKLVMGNTLYIPGGDYISFVAQVRVTINPASEVSKLFPDRASLPLRDAQEIKPYVFLPGQVSAMGMINAAIIGPPSGQWRPIDAALIRYAGVPSPY